MPSIRRRTALAAGLATAAACLAAPAAAGAQSGSIAYVKDHDVWIANPDGSGQHRVTRDGTESWPYRSPSQADDGTIAAAHGTDLVRVKQNGQELSRFDPPDTTDSAGQAIGGHPVHVALSPDGSKIASTYSHANCPVGVSCGVRYVTLYSHADRPTPPGEFGKLYRHNPSWASNDRLLAFNGHLSQVNYDAPGGGDDSDVHWFDDQELFDPSTDLGDGELSRQGDRFVAVRGYGPGTHLMIYKVTEDVLGGTPSGPPAYACNTGDEETLDSPTWAPDGRAVAFAHRDGVEVIPLPSVEVGCPGASSGTVVLPGASQPDWGPAAVNPGPPPSTGAPTPAPAPAPAPAPCASCRPAAPRPGAPRSATPSPAPAGPSGTAPAGRARDAARSARSRCLAKPSKAARTACLKRLQKAAALRACTRKPTRAARKRCVRKVNAARPSPRRG